jgi:hypothetical protein
MPEHYDFAAVMYLDRVCDIHICLTSSQLRRLASAMQEQFPSLIHLHFETPSHSRLSRALPDGFLGGSAPRLRFLTLKSIPLNPFPKLPKLLLSATDLVELTLLNIPHFGYISPEATVTGLATLAKLRNLHIGFESRLSRPDRESRHPPPPTRTVLPALTRFVFHGASKYLEDFVARVDAPLLDNILIAFFHQRSFDIPQLTLFMRHTTKFGAFHTADMDFNFNSHRVRIGFSAMTQTYHEVFRLKILCRNLNRQLSSLAQVLTSFFPSINKVELLSISGSRDLPSQLQDDIEVMRWLEIFSKLTAVKHLSISKEFSQSIALALQELVGERITSVLPALEYLFWGGQPSETVQEAVGRFIAARQLSGHPVAIHYWK